MAVKKETRDLILLEELWQKSTESERVVKKLRGPLLQAALLYQTTEVKITEEIVEITVPEIFEKVLKENLYQLKRAFNKPVKIKTKEE